MKQFCRLVKTHTFLTCLVLAAVLLVSIVIGIGTGPVAIPFSEVWRVMFHRLGGLLTGSELPLEGVRESTQNIVWFLRAPRVLLGALVGAALTLSGVGMQAFTKNPLAEPYVLGISSGASLGAVLAMLLGVSLPVLGRLSVSAGAFAGALVSILLVYLLARTRNAVTPIRLILVGVAVSAMFQAFTNYIVYTAPDDAAVREATFWMLGGLGRLRRDPRVLHQRRGQPDREVRQEPGHPLSAAVQGRGRLPAARGVLPGRGHRRPRQGVCRGPRRRLRQQGL